MQKNKLTYLILFLFITNVLFSQARKQDIHKINIPADDLLLNGRLYIPVHFKAQGFPYYERDEWMIADIYSMGEKFENKIVKFNIESEKLILNTDLNDRYINIELNTQNIDSFKIASINSVFPFNKKNKNDFDLIRKILTNIDYNSLYFKTFISVNNQFYQKIYQGKLVFVRKIEKEFKNNYSEQNHFGLYTDAKNIYYIYKNGTLFEVNSKNKFINFFPAHKKEIRKFIIRNKIKYKKASDDVLIKLLYYCDTLQK